MAATLHEDKGRLRAKLHGLLEDRRVHFLLLGLLLIDVAAVIVGSLLEVYYWESKFLDSEAVVIACVGGSSSSATSQAAGEYEHGGDASVSCTVLDYYGNSALHEAELHLVKLSIVILSLFILEHFVNMYVHMGRYFLEWYHPLDLFVVVVSLALEILALSYSGSAVSAGLLAVGRLWRFARIIHAITDVTNDVQAFIPTYAHEVAKSRGLRRGSWRHRLLKFLANRRVQLTLLTLLLLDVAFVILGSLLEVYYYQSQFYHSQDVVDACVSGGHRLDDGSTVPCALPDLYGNHALHDAELVLVRLSVFILSIFLLEHFLHLLVLQIDFFREWSHLVDLFIVLASMILEILVLVLHGNYICACMVAAGRFWRFARIIHGISDVVKDVSEIIEEEHEKRSSRSILDKDQLRKSSQSAPAKVHPDELCAAKECSSKLPEAFSGTVSHEGGGQGGAGSTDDGKAQDVEVGAAVIPNSTNVS